MSTFTDIESINTRLKYLEDKTNAMARKQTDFEAAQSDLIDRLATLEQALKDEADRQRRFAFQVGEWHGGYVKELGLLRHEFQQHLLNHTHEV